MIDFRYHLVSIVAVFLALAVGIVLGTTFLRDPALEIATETMDGVIRRNSELQTQVTALQRRAAGNDEFIAAAVPELVSGELTGERVLIVEPPGVTTAQRESVQEVLTQSGAAVSGRISLTDRYLDPEQTGLLDQLASVAKPAELSFAEDATAHERAAAVLAAAVVTGDQAEAGREDPAAAGVLDTFEKAEMITTSGGPALRATLAVVLAPADPYEGEDAVARNAALLTLATALDTAARGAVVAGPAGSAEPGGLIAALRDSDAADAVSGVDTIDMTAGPVVVVYALREQLAGEAGQYGIGPDAESFGPTPEPTPTPTSSSGG
ncbi:copper transporter [Thermostaphylospora chromogena]|uniref:Copper transport outer membrane protein, MctB n=1 Tax=Thermostaphylospora chromogena TaxID=35622 RepID=A0A1H1HLG1_9ACTN|nr:copper transporter [Thermostaphylospora chromogena]SDR26360.1 Copper transport outer membrane protein, MctB [Thermostaphylospora chromogena]